MPEQDHPRRIVCTLKLTAREVELIKTLIEREFNRLYRPGGVARHFEDIRSVLTKINTDKPDDRQ